LGVEALREGLAHDHVEIYYQPKIRLRDSKLVGVECLARWRDPERGIVGPDQFIEVLEEHHLIDEFTLLVLKKQ